MSIKNEKQERWYDPADQSDSTGIRVMELAYALEKDKQRGEVEKTISGQAIEKAIMGQVIVSQLKEGVIFYTNEYKEKAKKEQENELGE